MMCFFVNLLASKRGRAKSGEIKMYEHLSHFPTLFTEEERKSIREAPSYAGRKHPTWYPLCLDQTKLEATDYCLDRAVSEIRQSHHDNWLKAKVPSLLDLNTPSNASAAIAEIRILGGLLETGLNVTPVAIRKEIATPDFQIDLDGLIVEVEVAAKHQDQKQDQLQEEIDKAIKTKDPRYPKGVEHHVYTRHGVKVETTISEHQPGGSPDPDKPNDSVQTNLISRVCAIKEKEEQICGERPSILVIDFTSFGGRQTAGLLFAASEQAAPIISGHHGLTSGALWYAMYGWENAPVFEEGSARQVRMLHEGRFRLTGDRKSKLSAALLVLPRSVVLFENPWAMHRLPSKVRLAICRYPWFDLSQSIGDWRVDDALRKVELQEGMISEFEKKFSEMQTFWRMEF